ncbi:MULTISPECIES: PucR family transcriptional regulator [unclassified Leucobacter]|uniref:PucR family transcriptional regulator n=1 Tax=unclassified Leucobacter TaxID=2621730 RepID=UPI00165DFE46|nr:MULTISPECIES: PucR family transcriptional regulator [unclassified Leucobacter]MBC9927688.1 PucR family transcriptional regulator [Leucobacter sp. cx-169]
MATLSELLAIPQLGLRLVQAGPGDPEVTWVSTTELTDLSAYLDGGELVLTTGLSLGPLDPAWRDVVASLARARVAAIGFGVGVTHDRIPAPLVAAASDFRLALIEVPPPTPFIAVSKAVAGLLAGDELQAAHRALGAQQRIIDAAVGGLGPAAVLAILSSATGRQVGVIDNGGAIEAATAGFPAPDSPIDPLHAPPGWSFHPLDFEGGGGRLLAVHGPELNGPAERAAVTAASIALGLEQRQRAVEQEHARERWARAASLVLRGAPGARDAARVLDPSFALPAQLRVIGLQGTPEALAAWHRTPRSGTGRLVLRGPATASSQAPADPAHSAPRDLARAWQVIEDSPETIQSALLGAAGHGLDVAVGRPATPRTLTASLRSTLSLLDSLSPSAALYDAPRLPVARWAERDTPLLEALLSSGDAGPILSVLGELALGVSDDGSPESEHTTGLAERMILRESLRTLLEHGGRSGPAADALGVHRNTLAARIRKAEELTGRSLSRADDRAELWLALRAEELLGLEKR